MAFFFRLFNFFYAVLIINCTKCYNKLIIQFFGEVIMGKYQVADIKFQFDYLFDEYFKNNIEAYQIDDFEIVNHHIKVLLNNEIKRPAGAFKGTKNPYFLTTKTDRTIIFENNNQIGVLIQHDLDYKEITIILNNKLSNNLAQAEYVMSGIMFLELAMYRGYLPLHASAISLHNEAILFSAPSKTGKSTHAAYWNEKFPEVVYINDDKPLLNIENNELYVYGSPFSGEHTLNKNMKSKLKNIVLLNQGTTNKVEKVRSDEAINHLIKNTLNPKLDSSWDKVIPIINYIHSNIPIVSLDATNDTQAVTALYHYLFNDK